ncbi:DUF4870 family protein [Silvanigrella sp.]|jgi:uncharacterized membrane protein|uniref:DUF4870 family protein n=1 Tax=Silvanigrella sp. TaxID=2024976 RepID=UPI0037C88E40
MQHNDYYKNSSQNNLPTKSMTENVSMVVYVMQLISVFTGGLFSLIPLIITYLFRTQVKESWLDHHYRWQIQTFWFASIFYFLAWVFGLIPFIGWIFSIPLFLLASAIVIVRSIRGWKRLSIQKAPQNLIE